MDEGTGRGRDPDRTRACAECGWQGTEAAMHGGGAGDPVGEALACPRCRAPVEPDLPSVLEILAARRTPLSDEPSE